MQKQPLTHLAEAGHSCLGLHRNICRGSQAPPILSTHEACGGHIQETPVHLWFTSQRGILEVATVLVEMAYGLQVLGLVRGVPHRGGGWSVVHGVFQEGWGWGLDSEAAWGSVWDGACLAIGRA